MRHITPRHMMAFNDELSKEAGRIGDAFRAARKFVTSDKGRLTSRAIGEFRGRHGKQMLLGTGLGAVGGAAVADPDEPGSRIGGAIKGGLVGGALTGAGILSTREGRDKARKGIGNFYQRQKYSLTGKGLGKTEADQLKRAREIGLIEKIDPSKYSPDKFGKGLRGTLKADTARMADKARIAKQEHALRQGYLSAPGVMHGVLTRPGDVIRSGWDRADPMSKAFAGLGAYEAGKGFLEKPEPGGPGRMEKGMRGVGSSLGWMVAPTTLLGGQIVGMGGGYLGGKAGATGDRAVGMARSMRQRPGQIARPQQGVY